MARRTVSNPKTLICAVIDKLGEHYEIEQVFLYGSYARGWQNAWSDIDLAVVSRAFDRCNARTWQIMRRMAHAISPLLDVRPFGRREFEDFELGDFVHEIRRTGKSIYRNGRLKLPVI